MTMLFRPRSPVGLPLFFFPCIYFGVVPSASFRAPRKWPATLDAGLRLQNPVARGAVHGGGLEKGKRCKNKASNHEIGKNVQLDVGG